MSGIIQNMDSSKGQNGSFISFPYPITGEEIHRQLFEVVHRFNFKPNDDGFVVAKKSYAVAHRFDFKLGDNICLSFDNGKNNFTLFFSNYGFKPGALPIGWYPYGDFCEKSKEESLKFALEIFEEIEKIKKKEL